MKQKLSFGVFISAMIIYSLYSRKPLPPLKKIPDKVYDYIVVGAGSAGSVVASRLSENPYVTVLLVEAGGDDRGEERVTIPGFYGTMLDNAWALYVRTREIISDPTRDRISLRSGMIMGGGSSVNVQIYARGSRHDFDQWSALTKDKTWNYDHVLPYFKKSEGVIDDGLKASTYHGQQGPLPVSIYKNGWSIYKKLVDALKQLGYPENKDYNGASMEGVAYTQYNTVNGERVSSSMGFVHKALERPNLHVTIDAYVQRVLTREDRAYGVDMIKNSQKFTIEATKEVILSAGAIQTPKILMLSGIGPKAILTKHGIPVVKDLPVGKNLQNHPITDVPITVTSPVTGVLHPFLLVLSYLRYKLFKTGLFSTADADAMLFTSVDREARDKDWPDLQVMFVGKPIGTTFMKGFEFEEHIIKDLAKQRDANPFGFGCFPALLRPKGSGYMSIISNDPYDLPYVSTDFLDNKENIDLLIKGIRICQSLVNTTAMKSVEASLTDRVPLSLCKAHIFDSEDYWTCYIKQKPMLHYHPAGTCKMGSDDDPTAVLDSKLRVKGIKALRVVDASVMPTIVSANTNAATVMIAEKAADIIQGRVF